MSLTVVKVGGSLGRSGGLAQLCAALARTAARHDLVLVPGGGVFADAVRDLDAREGLDASAAHWMAVLAMEQYGVAIADLTPGSVCVRTAEELPLRRDDVAAVLLPYAWLRSADPLPHDWSVTSDSIAAWVARRCRAARLVLLKDGRGMDTPLRPGLPAPRGPLEAAELAAWEAVDGYFGRALDGLTADVWIVDGTRPESLDELLDGGATGGVSLRRHGT